MFLHVSVILFRGGVCPIACWDTPPWTRGRHTPRSRYPLGADTPRDQAHPHQRSACWEIRATSGRYASYGNAILCFFYIYRYALTVKVTKLFKTCGMLHFPHPLKSTKRKSISKIFSVFHMDAKKIILARNYYELNPTRIFHFFYRSHAVNYGTFF